MKREDIEFKTIENLVLQFGSDYPLGREVRKLYWNLRKENEEKDI